MAEGMVCPNSTSNPATHETWSEECLEECAAILAVKMDLSDMDTDLGPLDDPVNVPILTEGGVDFEPKRIQVGVESVITFKGNDIRDGAKAVFLPAGDHTCSGAGTVAATMSGAISHSRLNLTFPATGAYKLCMSFPSEQQGGEDSEFELADVFRRGQRETAA